MKNGEVQETKFFPKSQTKLAEKKKKKKNLRNLLSKQSSEQEILYLETKSNTKQVIAFPSYNIKAETITLNSRNTSDISFTQINVSKNSKQLKTVRENVNPHKQ